MGARPPLVDPDPFAARTGPTAAKTESSKQRRQPQPCRQGREGAAKPRRESTRRQPPSTFRTTPSLLCEAEGKSLFPQEQKLRLRARRAPCPRPWGGGSREDDGTRFAAPLHLLTTPALCREWQLEKGGERQPAMRVRVVMTHSPIRAHAKSLVKNPAVSRGAASLVEPYAGERNHY